MVFAKVLFSFSLTVAVAGPSESLSASAQPKQADSPQTRGAAAGDKWIEASAYPANSARGPFNTAGTLLKSGDVFVMSSREGQPPLVHAFRPASSQWVKLPSPGFPREAHTVTLLKDGRVLVAAGLSDAHKPPIDSAEIYDPRTEKWKPTASLAFARAFHTATLLKNGQVLVAGGGEAAGELFDPSSEQWTTTGHLAGARSHNTATRLRDGRVLVAGGTRQKELLGTTEIYDPGSATWKSVGNLTTPRALHTATSLSDGRVLVAGGRNVIEQEQSGIQFDPTTGRFLGAVTNSTGSAEIYDPATGQWKITGSLASARNEHAAVALKDGRVLALGGVNRLAWMSQNVPGDPFASAETYEPGSGLWEPGGPPDLKGPAVFAATLRDGRVLIVGSKISNSAIGLSSTTMLYTPEISPAARSQGSDPKAAVATPRRPYFMIGVGLGILLLAGAGMGIRRRRRKLPMASSFRVKFR